jgi:hypothetical protein
VAGVAVEGGINLTRESFKSAIRVLKPLLPLPTPANLREAATDAIASRRRLEGQTQASAGSRRAQQRRKPEEGQTYRQQADGVDGQLINFAVSHDCNLLT